MANNRVKDLLNGKEEEDDDDEPTIQVVKVTGKGAGALKAALKAMVADGVPESVAKKIMDDMSGEMGESNEDDDKTAEEAAAYIEAAAREQFTRPGDAILYALDKFREMLAGWIARIEELGVTEEGDPRALEVVARELADIPLKEHAVLAWATHCLMETLVKHDKAMATSLVLRWREERMIDRGPATDLRQMFDDPDGDEDDD